MSGKPRIGISAYRETAAWGVWKQDAATLPATYVDCVAAAGGIPLLLPPIDDTSLAAEAVETLDGLVISGGPDVDPARYDEPPHEKTDQPRVQRDAWELALLAAALERDLPVLGICRGAQLFNVHFGGSLNQHIEGHKAGPAVFERTPVSLDVEELPGSILGDAVTVSCYHHQALGRLGDGLTVTGRAPDGTIEAVAVNGRAFAVGVQWHPEHDRELRLFAALIEQSEKEAANR
ncbi:MAG TPA: gamma-glutamyl-gamma-aminobutyrate hydrolase family protein [Actinospica sp.]|nr:gamma-glutamyl-gamma-aminobutyrate hydrolase family protein [Actinospica sp.]